MARSKKTMEDALALVAHLRENPEDSVLDMAFFESDLSPGPEIGLDEYLVVHASLPVKPTGKPIPAGGGLPPVSGTTSITIRIPTLVVQAFKTHADKKGIGYQTYMNRVLKDAVKSFV
jgi:uncharacterized protein (DUF4415 family)